MPITLQGLPKLSVGDTDIAAIDLTDYLDSGETFTGTPTVVEITTTDLTITNKQVNTAALTLNGRTVAIGAAIQFKISGQLAARSYTIQVTGSTTSGRTLTFYVKFYSV